MDKERLYYLLTHSDWSDDDCLWMNNCIQNHEDAVYDQLRLLLTEDESVENVPALLSERVKKSLLHYINDGKAVNNASKRYLSGESEAFFQKKLKEDVVWTRYSVPDAGKPPEVSPEKLDVEMGKQRFLIRKKLYWAAAILLLFILSIFMTKYLQNENKVPLHGKIALNKKAILPVSDTIFNASDAEQTVYLSDSTKVVLKPNSYIYFDKVFARDKKIVHIHGEATFSVNNEVGRPFSVFAGHMEVRDLGTVFYVNNRGNHLSVKLIEGKVLLHSMELAKIDMSDIVLKPGELFKMDKNTQKYQLVAAKAKKTRKKPVKIDHPVEKAERSMNFVNAPLMKVLDNVADKYQLHIKYNQKGLSDKLFTGNLTKVDSADKVLLLICIPNNLRYSKKGDTIIIE